MVLLDVHLPGGGGRAVLRAVRAGAAGNGSCLALSVSDAAEDVIAVIRAGARGYVTKAISGAELRRRHPAGGRGRRRVQPRLAGFVLDAFAGPRPTPAARSTPDLDLLSAREREVMRLLARGYTYREIGRGCSSR